MVRPRFSIGIDLGTTNCALAFVPLDDETRCEIFGIPQWDTLSAIVESPALPSFLYLPDEAAAAQIQNGKSATRSGLSAGSHAKRQQNRPAGSSIRRSPGSATIHPIARRDFCPGDRTTMPATARYRRYAPRR